MRATEHIFEDLNIMNYSIGRMVIENTRLTKVYVNGKLLENRIITYDT
jgi:hypothetical protein